MTILPIPAQNSSSVHEFFKQGGKVEIPRPQECSYELCRLQEPLRKNGSYARQVIYWGLYFLVQICRFRCKRCGRTASCPYSWLVPYRRFSAEVIAAGIEAYASKEVTYRDLDLELSDLELAEPEMDIRAEGLYENVVEESIAKQIGKDGEPRCRPAHTTIFNWVGFVCDRVEALLMQIQKELVQEKKRGRGEGKLPAESVAENPNSGKAASVTKGSKLDRVSFAACAARLLLARRQHEWYGLRAYFLAKAESRKDVLTDTQVRLPITQTFEQVIF